MKRVLFMEWKSYGNVFLNKVFQKKGFEVIGEDFPTDKEDTQSSPELAERVTKKIIETRPYFVFSFNYYPVIAIACKACRVPYLAWIYDSPFIQLYSETLPLDTNHVFIFDKVTYNELVQRGIETVHYLPMGAPVDFYDTFDHNTIMQQKHQCDVAFVGSLYREKKHNLFRYLDDLDTYTSGYIAAIMEAQKKIYGYHFLEEVLTDEIMNNIRKVCPVSGSSDGAKDARWTFAHYILSRKITAIERFEILQMLGKEHLVRLYTPENTEDMPEIRNMGSANYYNEAPYVYKNASINLNISLRSIVTGIPLRAFDIMGCGGFLISNYQEEFLEHFIPNEDVVLYGNYEELGEQVKFYLEHEEERKRIASNGYEKVKKFHTLEHRVEQMLEILHERGNV